MTQMAAKFVSAAEHELSCPVCFQFYVMPHEPKNLPKCSHILCKLCLNKMVGGGLKTIKCPQCNKVSTLSKKGVDGLKTSLVARNLAERHPEGIKQRKEHIQCQFKNEEVEMAKRLVKITEVIKKTQHAIELEEQEIEKAVKVAISTAKELINQLRNTSGLDQLQQELVRVETQMKSIETSQSKLETMKDDDFHVQTDALSNQIQKLKINEATENATNDQCVGKFIANVQLGRIVKPRRLELVQEFGEFEYATGIALNPNGVLVVCDSKSNPKRVTVFHNDNSQYKNQCQFFVTSGNEGALLDIAISGEGMYLVAKREAGFDVHSTDGKYKKTASVVGQKPGQQRFDEATGLITTTDDGRILTGSAITEGEESTKTVVTIHDAVGNLLKTIPVNIRPFRITDVNGTHVAVSGSEGKVCVYDLQSGKETLNLSISLPGDVCYDEQSDCLLIGRGTEKVESGKAVHGSGVIEQYCCVTGALVACLAQRLQAPLGIIITGDNMLAVTDKKTVKLYKMN